MVVQDEGGNQLMWNIVRECTEIRTMHGTEISKNKVKDVRSPDGRTIYSKNEGDFYSAEEPDRTYRIVGESE